MTRGQSQNWQDCDVPHATLLEDLRILRQLEHVIERLAAAEAAPPNKRLSMIAQRVMAGPEQVCPRSRSQS